MEIKVDEASPVMIEVGARMHGGVAPQLFTNCHSPHLLEMSVNAFLATEHNLKQSTLINNGRIIFLVNYTSGKFNLPISLQDLESLSSYKGHKFFISDNEYILPTIDLNTCPGIFWLSHTDNSIMLQDEKIIQKRMHDYIS